VFSRKVKAVAPEPLQRTVELVAILRDRARSAVAIQARAFDELSAMQRMDKQKALTFAEATIDLLDKEQQSLTTELRELEERFKTEIEPNRFALCENDLRLLKEKNKSLQDFMTQLKVAIQAENDPKVTEKRKKVESLLGDAKLALGQADYDVAIAKYEEAIKVVEDEMTAKAELQKALDQLKKDWQTKDDEHKQARTFVYESWVKLETPLEVRDQMPNAKKALAKLIAVNDRISLTKMLLASANVQEKYVAQLKMSVDEATDQEEKEKIINGYLATNMALEEVITALGKALGVKDK
jgi:tetratricopeptide (TPR) repeat protein